MPGSWSSLLQVKYGAFNNLHSVSNGAKFANTLKTNCSKYYGVAGISYLEKLVTDYRNLSKLLKTAEAKLSLLDMGEQEYRACTAFALVRLLTVVGH